MNNEQQTPILPNWDLLRYTRVVRNCNVERVYSFLYSMKCERISIHQRGDTSKVVVPIDYAEMLDYAVEQLNN